MCKLFLCNLKAKLLAPSGSWLGYLTQQHHLLWVPLWQGETQPTQRWLGSYLQISCHLHKKKMCECVFLFYRIIWSCLKMKAKVFKSKGNNLWRRIQYPPKNVICLVWECLCSKEAINEYLTTLVLWWPSCGLGTCCMVFFSCHYTENNRSMHNRASLEQRIASRNYQTVLPDIMCWWFQNNAILLS